jgi:rhamnosyltransferase
MMKLCAVLISYYPELEAARERIYRYIDYVDHLVIWENTPEGERMDYRITVPEHQAKISYMSTGRNEGIGYPLNRAVEYAVDNGYTHLLTMDQDSYWEDFGSYKRLAEANADSFALAAPNVNQRWKSRTTLTDVKACITSGSIFNVSLFGRIGLFREDYFIDGVDTEFCYRMVKNAEPILLFAQVELQQRFGETKKRLGLIKIRSYSAFRTYHILRNHIWLWREYPDIIEPRLKKWIVMRNIVKRIPKILFVESDKLEKYKQMVRGISDGLRGE